MLRTRLKRIIPGPIWRAVRRADSYRRRRTVWRHIQQEMTGVTVRDQAILARSSRQAWAAEWRDLDHWHDPLLLQDATVDVCGVGRFQLRAATDDLYHVLPFREREIFHEIRSRLSPGSTFVDAGANIGVFTVLAGRLVGPEGKVVAIEMIPETAGRLRNHLALNGLSNVSLVERALSDRSGERISASIPEGRFGQASIINAASGSIVSVDTITLDEAVETEDPITLMKIDLEGAELKALTGARRMLERTKAVIFEELGEKRDVIDLLVASGLKVRRLAGHNFIAER